MANRRPQGGGGGRRDFQRNDRNKNFGRSNVSPWQTGPGPGINSLFPLAGGSKEATLALASNIISLLQPRPNPVPSLLDMPIRRDFGPNVGRYDRNPGPNRMGNQGHFRRSGNFNRSGDRGHNRKPFKANDGRQQNKNSPRKDADYKSKAAKESTTTSSESKKDENDKEAENGSKNESKDKESPKTRFDDINTQFLKCHICNKSMWDGRSFENHLSGRAHAIMMQKTVESYALAADTMRQEYKIREMKRTRKTGQPPSRDFYCAMCDMYAADGAAHRTTVGHRKLKKYLHPSCTSCHKEMPTRIELDEHRLTPEHLRTLQDKSDLNNKPKPEVLVISTMGMEQIYLRDDRQRRQRRQDDRKPKEEKDQDENMEETVEIKKEPDAEEGDKEKTEGEDKPNDIDSENTVVDYKEGDSLDNFTKEMLPIYSTIRGVGRSFIEEFKCYSCKLCRKLLDTEETAEVHLKTWRHHQLFTKLLQDKSGCKTVNETSSSASQKRKLDSKDEDVSDEKRIKTEADDGQNGLDGNKEGDAENETCNAEEDLEDWENTMDDILEDEHLVDEILEDEQYNPEEPNEDNDDPPAEPATKDKVEEAPEQAKEEEKEPEEPQVKEEVPEKVTPAPTPAPVQEPTPAPATAATPQKTRGTARGRGTPRGRGRRGRMI